MTRVLYVACALAGLLAGAVLTVLVLDRAERDR